MLAQAVPFLLDQVFGVAGNGSNDSKEFDLISQCIGCESAELCADCKKQLCHPVKGACNPLNPALEGHYNFLNGCTCVACNKKGRF
jgi:hypothetical protein